MEHTYNRISVRGILCAPPCYSHDNHGKTFFKMLLQVQRLSGTSDILPVIAQESLLSGYLLDEGDMLHISGQIRSHNSRTDGVRRLNVFIFASSIEYDESEPINDVILHGPICRAPVYRTTPLGREICDIMLAVPRSFKRADYLPCILWGKTAQMLSSCSPGEWIYMEGRMQSRIYTKQTDKGPIERTAYEISALRAERSDPETEHDLP